MYEVIKVLNNNTILVQCENDEVIVMFKGIGFGKKVHDQIEIPTQAKRYLMQKSYQPKGNQRSVIDYI